MNVIRWLCGAVLGIALGILLMALSATAQLGGPPAAHGPRPRTTPESIAAGKALFEGTCANCHGIDGSGANGPNIRDAGTTIVLVDHDMQLVLSLCDEIHVLVFGSLVSSGPPELVKADPQVASAYLGGTRAEQPTGVA